VQQKWWSIFFGVVLAATFLIWLVAPFTGWWLPTDISTFGGEVDYLFYVILGLTGFFFVLTEVLLVYAMYRFAYRPGEKSVYVEGNHRLEVLWTIVPAAILLFIAFAQIRTWEKIKYQSRMPKPDQIVQVTGRQWEWRIRYPADINRDAPQARRWAEAPEIDDLYGANDLHVWKGANVKIFLKTNEVLHSFFLPNLRLKQDALPGKTIPMWFQATQSNTSFNETTGQCETPKGDKAWEIACAELCGGGHYRMRGLLYVHPDEADYKKWLEHELKAQRSREPEKAPATPVAMNQGQ
jgi:cytochrome c oxidase subunit 2